MNFNYSSVEMEYLKNKDEKIGEVIDKIGYIEREIDSDLFSAVVHHIVGQQISTKAQITVWNRIQKDLGDVNAQTVFSAGIDNLQSFGISYRKASYIYEFAIKVKEGEFDLESVCEKSDSEAIAMLSSLKGIGVWTAEMILLFCLERPNIFSFNDIALLRGLRMVYHHRKIDRKLFEKYRRRFSPYCSIASFYLWAVAGGAIEGMRDYAPGK